MSRFHDSHGLRQALGGARRRSGCRLSSLNRLFVTALALWPLSLPAQQQSQRTHELPDAPDLAFTSTALDNAASVPAPSGVISGTVLDSNGSEVQDAQVDLHASSGEAVRSERSNNTGQFAFNGLPPGNFKIIVSGQGWGVFESPEIQLHSGDNHLVPNVVLPITTSAMVRVVADRNELSVEQVQIAEQQRIFAVFPNFYTSYDWNAPPMETKQKIQLALRSSYDPITFAGAATRAAAEQVVNTFPAYGTGTEGYARRFGAAYANDITGNMFSHAIYPTLFHQDPRYFYRGSGSIFSRALYAVSAVVIARGDAGNREPNYSTILSSFTAAGISNLYVPAADRGFSLTVFNALANLGEHAGTNILREFVSKQLTSRASKPTAATP